MAVTTAIALSGERMQVLTGVAEKARLKIKKAYSIPLEEGAVLNGVITNDAPVRAALEQVRKNGVRKARLVLDSSLILIKNATVPVLPAKKLLDQVRRELAEMEGTYDELLYDYSVVTPSLKDGGGVILCSAVERKFIDSYAELFKAARIELVSVDISVNAVNKLVGLIPELRNKTYILSMLDGSNVVSILYENGVYSFSSRSRLFAQRATEPFFAELSGKISSLIQFNKSQKSPYAIESAYFCGLTPQEIPMCGELGAVFGIESEPFPNFSAVRFDKASACTLAEYLYTAGCLIRK